MLDFVGEVAWILSPILGLSTVVWSLWEFRRVEVGRRVIASALFGIAVTWLCLVVALQIVLRDGLGPDSVESTGDIAMARVFDGMWLGFASALVPVALGAWTIRRAHSRRGTVPKSRPKDSLATG
jgi:hypothetical protein